VGAGVTKEWVQGKTREELDALLLEADRVIRLREAGEHFLIFQPDNLSRVTSATIGSSEGKPTNGRFGRDWPC
jgi:hypothetical protein